MPMYERYVTCESCDCGIDREFDAYRVVECGCCFECADCLDGISNNRNYAGQIHSYSYKPRRFLSKGNFPDEVLMGVELEMGGIDAKIADRVYSVDNDESHLYCKSDCSIYGAEIVSHPMTLNYVKEWAGWSNLLEKLREDECYTDKADCICGDGSYCRHEYGLHIHVSRNAFRQLKKRRVLPEPIADNETYEQRIGREMREMLRQQRDQQAINHQMIWLMFLERNSDKLAGDLGLARRDPSQYGPFKKSNLEELRAKSAEYPYSMEGRYTAINCQNDKTYELRFFKSTVDTVEFYAALEFADASVEFTRTLNANDVLRNRGLEWSKFVEWTMAQEMGGVVKYPNLISQMQSLALV